MRVELEKLSEGQIDKLLDKMDIGISQELDKDEKILLLSTEPEEKIREVLKRLVG